MEPNTSQHQPLHLVVFPWLAFGHIIPYLKLSIAIAKKGHKISFLCTPRNLKRMPKIPTYLSSSIDLVELHLPAVDGLPKEAEATSDIPLEKMQYLTIAFDGLMQQVLVFLKGASPKPDWIIQDYVQHWMADVSTECDIPCMHFSVVSSPSVFWGSPDEMITPTRTKPEDFTVKPKWIPFETKVALKPYEARLIMMVLHYVNSSGISEMHRAGNSMKHCKLVALRDCEELHSKWLRVLEDAYQKPILPVGLLPPSTEEIELSLSSSSSSSEIMQWLDKQPPSSVLYVAFGSEATLEFKVMHELALGLELSGVPFLWAFRKPRNMSDEDDTFLQEFQHQIQDQSLLVMGWVPQIKVLSHASIGGFLTHCGSSSIIESLVFGQPPISLPNLADQWIDTREMAEKNVVLEIERDEEDGSLRKEAVARAVRTVMVEEEGEVYRAATREISKICSDSELHDQYMDRFINALVKYHC